MIVKGEYFRILNGIVKCEWFRILHGGSEV
jgi:hypothetical protein